MLRISIKRLFVWFDKLPTNKRQRYFYNFALIFFMTWMFTKIITMNAVSPIKVDLIFLTILILICIPRILHVKKLF